MEVNISWETFIQSTIFLPTTSQPTSHNTPLAPLRPHEIGSSSRFSVRRALRVEITQTYRKGKRLVFSPEITKEATTPRTPTRTSAKLLPKETSIEQIHEGNE